MKYLLDTHTWIWWHMRPEKLSRKVKALIADSTKYEELLLSAISPWEFSKLLEKGRLGISCNPEVWINSALEMPKLRLVPLSPVIAYRSTILPPKFHDDPADQIIVATARAENATILTKDSRIQAYKHIKALW
ncbi:MAG: type II toxin-antitoxin system VapC family toxin [Proteobacteria bacterium]|nr:type II toxin-antitoxin system VapC family toxin [Desulfobacteraceae bacterium]MBU2522484.1 type II toxin-antitoxin system VapC family toxin [Pseudomonadota bacterium]MBU3980387.1 type II toxin-antitoxin system VapC family toxin [Pseudomonadota bacterium]MBU4014036.1 type II toxin-antitoxin system VapC family toxin [Pseudomonadota bacterium]MBU4066858.1 type II toxin-antitoxin system VapC family toxin [Pseudomonadota bacterium]